MEITNLTIKIVLLAMPGLICYYIISKLTEPKEENYLSILTEIIVYSFISYSIYAVVALIGSFFGTNWKSEFLNSLTSPMNIPWIEVIMTSFFSIILACLISIAFNNSYFYKIARELKLTRKFGDIDVWAYLFNSSNTFYIIIRDIENNLTYQGYPKAFSREHKNAEVLLQNVSVYNYIDSKLLYKCNSMYYKFNTEKILFEILPIEREDTLNENS